MQFYHCKDVGLTVTSSDFEIWQCCQERQLVLITDNRNQDSPDSLEATIRSFGTADSLPVFTLGRLDRYRANQTCAKEVVERVYEYLLDIDRVRGAGRI